MEEASHCQGNPHVEASHCKVKTPTWSLASRSLPLPGQNSYIEASHFKGKTPNGACPLRGLPLPGQNPHVEPGPSEPSHCKGKALTRSLSLRRPPIARAKHLHGARPLRGLPLQGQSPHVEPVLLEASHCKGKTPTWSLSPQRPPIARAKPPREARPLGGLTQPCRGSSLQVHARHEGDPFKNAFFIKCPRTLERGLGDMLSKQMVTKLVASV